MGCFDRIKYQNHMWQTKDLGCAMETYRVGTNGVLYRKSRADSRTLWLPDYFTGRMDLICEACGAAVVETHLTFDMGILVGEGPPVTGASTEAPAMHFDMDTGKRLGAVTTGEPQGVPAEQKGWPLSPHDTQCLVYWLQDWLAARVKAGLHDLWRS